MGIRIAGTWATGPGMGGFLSQSCGDCILMFSHERIERCSKTALTWHPTRRPIVCIKRRVNQFELLLFCYKKHSLLVPMLCSCWCWCRVLMAAYDLLNTGAFGTDAVFSLVLTLCCAGSLWFLFTIHVWYRCWGTDAVYWLVLMLCTDGRSGN